MSNEQIQTIVNTDIQSLGAKAVDAWKSSERNGAKGDALSIVALFEAYHTLTFVARVHDKKGHLESETSFDLSDYIDERGVTKLDGTKDKKLVGARLEAIAEKVFGVKQPDQNLKNRILRSLKSVGYLASRFDIDDVKLSKRNELMIPYVALHDAPDADAGTNEIKKYEIMSDQLIALDGKEGNTLAALSRKANPPKKREVNQTDAKIDQGQAFTSSIKFALAMMPRIIGTEEDGSEFTASEELRKTMFELQTQLAAYFDIDPIEEEKPAKKANDKKAA